MKALHNRTDRKILKAQMAKSHEVRRTLSFYAYASIGNVRVFRDHLYTLLESVDVLGRIYVAQEGVNGQVSVPRTRMDDFQQALYSITFLDGCRLNYAIEDDGKSFYKLIIKIRPKIVADGLNDDEFDVRNKGTHVDAAAFNTLTNDPETIIVDMRNHYESEVGHFRNAITPQAETFREALPEVEALLEGQQDKHIVMYCTGGIRCEKASAYYKHRGFHHVYQLDGGIIEYCRQVEELGMENKFIGKNFVFDERLGERITADVISSCHQCGAPSDHHQNCANDACHLLFIQCDHCAARFNHCCSSQCRAFIELPIEEQRQRRFTETFNGSRFGKRRYKANGPPLNRTTEKDSGV